MTHGFNLYTIDDKFVVLRERDDVVNLATL